MARFFHGLIFAGNEKGAEQYHILSRLLQEAIMCSASMQQPGHPKKEAEFLAELEWQANAEKEIREFVEDIAAALLGQKINFGEKLPYPTDPKNGTVVGSVHCFKLDDILNHHRWTEEDKGYAPIDLDAF